MYRQFGSVVYVAMSADSSCRGLRTAKDGPVVLELTQGGCLALFKTINYNINMYFIKTIETIK